MLDDFLYVNSRYAFYNVKAASLSPLFLLFSVITQSLLVIKFLNVCEKIINANHALFLFYLSFFSLYLWIINVLASL